MANAGVAPVCMFEDYPDITRAAPAMVILLTATTVNAQLLSDESLSLSFLRTSTSGAQLIALTSQFHI